MSGVSSALAIALFRLAFRLFPREHRDLVESEAVEAFGLGYRRRRAESGLWSAWRYAWRSVVDAVVAGWRIRRLHRVRRGRSPAVREEAVLLTDLRGLGGCSM